MINQGDIDRMFVEVGDIVYPETHGSFVHSKHGYLCPSCGGIASMSRTKPPATCRECGYDGVDDEHGYIEGGQ